MAIARSDMFNRRLAVTILWLGGVLIACDGVSNPAPGPAAAATVGVQADPDAVADADADVDAIADPQTDTAPDIDELLGEDPDKIVDDTEDCSCTGDESCVRGVCDATPSVCGDGVIRGESCDDGNTADGDGCSASCVTEDAWSCVGTPSVCHSCGNGFIEGTEVCDTADLDGLTCLGVGHRSGAANDTRCTTGGLACAADCGSFDVGACGTAIVDRPTLQGAIDDAFACDGREAIRLREANSPLDLSSGPVILDEHRGTCDSLPAVGCGVVLQPYDGENVVLVSGSAGPALRIISGGHSILGLTFDGAAALDLQPTSADKPLAGLNVVRGNRFVNTSEVPANFVAVASPYNTITANLFEGRDSNESSALRVDVTDNTVSMNVIAGGFANAVVLAGTDNPVDSNYLTFQHNTVHLVGGGNALRLSGEHLYLHNNLIVGTSGAGIGIYINGDYGLDGGPYSAPSGHNAVFGFAHQYVDRSGDADFCSGAGPLCDQPESPAFTDAKVLCLAAGSAFIDDLSVPILVDMVDGNDALYLGLAPEMGARESGATRIYGNVTSSCP